MKYLCDANLWLALTLELHGSRPLALKWYSTLQPSDTLAFCRSSQQTFLRLITNRAICGEETRSNREAQEGFRKLRANSQVEWLEEPAGIERLWFKYASLESASSKVWMDAYLAAFAVQAKARLVTFDQGFGVYQGLDWINLNI